MPRFSLRLSIAVSLFLALPACGDDGATTDAGTDSAPADAMVDAAPMPDAMAMPDATPDAMPDATADAMPDAAAGDTWETFAEGFFATYCVECHSGSPRDYRTMDDVIRDQSTIACGVHPEARADCPSFPPPGNFPVGAGPKPSDDERRRLVAWIDDGMP